MASEITIFPNGHDSTGMPEEPAQLPTPQIQVIGASDFAPEVRPTTKDKTTRRIPTVELYSEFENVSPELNSAARLLSLSLEHLDRALRAQRDNDPIEADDATQRMQALLPELFCFRSLGDGFGIVVNGLLCGFQNLEGIPLQRDQLEKVRQTLLKLRSEPFLRESDAVTTVTVLEQAGFVVEPPEFEYLADLLDE
jgi:hypothetical protein